MLETRENYPSDLELRHAVTGYRSNDIAGILENAIYLELLRQGFRSASASGTWRKSTSSRA